MAAAMVRIHLQIPSLASSLVPFPSTCLHEPTRNRLCVSWLTVETDDCNLTFNQNWNLKPQIQGIWKVTVKVTITWKTGKRRRMREDTGHESFPNVKAVPPIATVSLQSNELVLFGWWARVDVSPEPRATLSVRAIIYLTLTVYHKANLDFPKASVLKHLSSFKLQAKLG